MPELLTDHDAGLIIAALEEYAAEHPDPDTADRCAELAERIATRTVTLGD